MVQKWNSEDGMDAENRSRFTADEICFYSILENRVILE